MELYAFGDATAMKTMIAVKVKDAALWLPRFLNLVEKLEDPIGRVIFMYGDSHDASLRMLKHYKQTSRHKVEVYHEPYMPIANRGAHGLAAVKRDIQQLLKQGDEDYYLSFDPDLVQFPSDLITQLARSGYDVTVPMVWIEKREVPIFFDTYMFRKHGCMFHPLRPPGLNETEPFPIDSFGNVCGLRKREAELAGKYSNPYPNIPFCQSLKDQGYTIYLDPRVHVYHADLEHFGIMHHPLNHPYSYVPYIASDGKKYSLEQVQAELHQADRELYDKWFDKTFPEESQSVSEWWNKRPLLTASYKVFNEARFLEYSLKSIYSYVDRIDIVEGAMTDALPKAKSDGSSKDGTVELIKTFPDPEKKIKLIQGKWQSREEIQAKLLEVCASKWMLYIDGDEILTQEGMQKVRQFCEANQDGQIVYARPERFVTFWHDFKHIAYSMDPLSPWGQYSTPHAFLIWTDIPGLNFNVYHTIPYDGFGVPISLDYLQYRKRQQVLDGVLVYHFGNAKGEEALKYKLTLRDHDRMVGDAKVDPWLSGVMPEAFILEEWKDALPTVLDSHPDHDKQLIRITETEPVYKFEVI
jgi:hypothetical protein